MQYHKWSQQDLALLEGNVRKYGLTSGCEKTASELALSVISCIRKHRSAFGPKRKNHKWTDSDVELLTKLVRKHGVTKGSSMFSETTGISVNSATSKACKLAVSNKTKRKHMSDDEEHKLADFLVDRISKNPGNLIESFREASDKFGVSVTTIARRWYGFGNAKSPKSPACRNNIGTVFSVVGENSLVNGKNGEPKVKHTGWILSFIRRVTGSNKKK